MKVLFLSRLFYPHIGGVEKHVLEISKILVAKGHDVTVLTEKYDKSFSKEEKIGKIRIIRIDTGEENWFKKFKVWKNVWSNRKLIIDADIIHAHDVFFWFLPFRFVFLTKKIFVTFHGYEGNNLPGFKAKLSHKIAEKLSRGNICVGDFLKKWYGTKPDYVIYGGVNLPKNTKVIKISKNIKFLYLGRLEEETGIMEYLKALVLLRNKIFKFELTILGDGSLLEKAEKFAKKNKINASFKGFQKNIEKYLRQCDFVFTSRYLGILEASSFKKFVFAVYNNQIKKDYLEMSSFAKFISISKDYKELSDQIKYFLKNNLKKNQMIDKGHDWVKDQTWGGMTNLYIDLWNQEQKFS